MLINVQPAVRRVLLSGTVVLVRMDGRAINATQVSLDIQ